MGLGTGPAEQRPSFSVGGTRQSLAGAHSRGRCRTQPYTPTHLHTTQLQNSTTPLLDTLHIFHPSSTPCRPSSSHHTHIAPASHTSKHRWHPPTRVPPAQSEAASRAHEAARVAALGEEEDEEELVRQRARDDFRDANPRGWGNSKIKPCG